MQYKRIQSAHRTTEEKGGNRAKQAQTLAHSCNRVGVDWDVTVKMPTVVLRAIQKNLQNLIYNNLLTDGMHLS